MGGGLIQLVAQGVQNVYLTEDPQITFFKSVYRRHTNFSIESIIQNFSTQPNFGETVSCTISRAGDLVGKIMLYVEIPSLPKFIDPNTGDEDHVKKLAWVRNLGFALIEEISIEIGGKQIDKQYGEWMYIWSQLTNLQDEGLNKMIGNIPELYQFTNGKQGYRLYIPLQFWFCKNTGLALPLVSLSSSDVKIIVTFRKLEECYRLGPTNYIEILEDIIPFKLGDYIEQKVNNRVVYGYVMDYDYLKKRLYYIKIQSPLTSKNSLNTMNAFGTLQDNSISNLNDWQQINLPQNKEYRIYNSITNTYCTPRPNTQEESYNVSLSIKPQFVNSYLYVDYVYLDNDERNKFIKSHNEYLIEQLQFNQDLNVKSPNVKYNLNLNHPCKAHYWVAQLDRLVGPGTINDIFNYTSSHIRLDNYDEINRKNDVSGLVEDSKLVLNGRNRFDIKGSEFSNLVDPYSRYSRGPAPGINVYSFSLYPELYQPSSTINMSRIDQISMILRLNNQVGPDNTCKIRSYTINYNLLRIVLNLGGLVFV